MKTLAEIKEILFNESGSLNPHDASHLAIFTGALDRYQQGKGDPTVTLTEVSDAVVEEIRSYGFEVTTTEYTNLRGVKQLKAEVKLGE